MKLRFTNVINFLLINEVFLLKIRNTSKRNPLCILDEIYEFMAFWRKKKEITTVNLRMTVFFCAMPWVHLHVTQNGNITPYCQTPCGDEAKLGGINTSSIQENWKVKPFENFRK